MVSKGFVLIGILMMISAFLSAMNGEESDEVYAKEVIIKNSRVKNELSDIEKIRARLRQRHQAELRRQQVQVSKNVAIKPVAKSNDVIFARWSRGWTPAALASLKARFGKSITLASRKYSVDPDVVVSVIGAESSGQNVKGDRGEVGPMQCKPSTCTKYVGDAAKLEIPHYNILGGTAYIHEKQELYGDDLVKVIAAYNWGTPPKGIDPNKNYHLRKFFYLYSVSKNG